MDNEKVFFIFKDSEATPEEYLAKLYNTLPGEKKVELQQVDMLKTDAGIDFTVYQLVTKK